MDTTVTEKEIAEAARKLTEECATLSELKGITPAEMEAVYSLGFNYYKTGRLDDAAKIFQFLVLFDHLNPKYWIGVGAIQQIRKDYDGAVVSYGYASFLDLKNPKPQYHAAECFLAKGDKTSAASAICALEHYCPGENTEIGREYRAKARKLRELIGEEAFAKLETADA